ncbi:MAG: ATP-binding protein [Clostridiaceae bacterium]
MIKSYSSKISKNYKALRKNEESNLKARKDEISKKIPKIDMIDRKIATLSINLCLNSLKGISSEDSLTELKDTITNLRAEKYELLVSNNYPMDYLELHYNCELCKDTGYIGNNKCSCYKKHVVKLYYEDSNLKDILDKNNFNKFKLDFYSSTKGIEKESPRKNMEKTLGICKDFISQFHTSNENLFFYGDPGTGKTLLSSSIGKALLDRGYLVVYKTAEDLIQDLRQIRFNNNYYLQDLLNYSDLLIIDDLGTEETNDFSAAELFNLLNKRIMSEKSMIISTNLQLNALNKNYSDRITSRLMGDFTICKFYGEDIRIKKNLNRLK